MNKEQIIEVIKELPENASMDDVIERILFMKSVEDSISDFKEGKFYAQEEIENMVWEWHKSYGR